MYLLSAENATHWTGLSKASNLIASLPVDKSQRRILQSTGIVAFLRKLCPRSPLPVSRYLPFADSAMDSTAEGCGTNRESSLPDMSSNCTNFDGSFERVVIRS